MNKTSLLMLSLAVLISACSKETEENSGLEQDKGLVYDSEMNMYVPENFYEYDFKLVGNLFDIPDLLDNEIIAGQLPEQETAGMVMFRQQISLIAKGHDRGIDEVSATVPQGYVITGVGANINRHKNYNCLMIEFRYIIQDGTMGPRYRVWDTSRSIFSPDQMEAWCSVPIDAVAVGIGIKGTADVDRLDLFYRYLDAETLRLSENEHVVIGGLRPWRGNNYDLCYKPEEHDLDKQRSVMLGLSFMAYSKGKTTRMHVDVGYLE